MLLIHTYHLEVLLTDSDSILDRERSPIFHISNKMTSNAHTAGPRTILSSKDLESLKDEEEWLSNYSKFPLPPTFQETSAFPPSEFSQDFSVFYTKCHNDVIHCVLLLRISSSRFPDFKEARPSIS